ncbi:MAG: DUF3795 domain-containing protein, partial [Chloroflexi bacterium]|nr:DUF3795 domain-containing protein [Chloroflexota bacterium]
MLRAREGVRHEIEEVALGDRKSSGHAVNERETGMSESCEDLRKLAAPCGLYCGACSIRAGAERGDTQFLELAAAGIAQYLGHPVKAEDLNCEGCLADVLAIQCRECTIRDCAVSKGFTRCAECGDFPCPTITAFNNDGMAHHGEVLENIRR